MSSNIIFTWKEENFEDASLVKSFIDSVSKGLNQSIDSETIEIQVAQSDRLIDFSILIMVDKTVEDLGGQSAIGKWKSLNEAHRDIDTTRLYIDSDSKIELEIFHDATDNTFSFMTHLHFHKPTEDSDQKKTYLEIEANKVGYCIKKGFDFLKN